jgi:hypothetical protein
MITQKAQHQILSLASDIRVRTGAETAGYVLGGFLLSGISLAGAAQPLSLGFLLTLTGWRTLAAAVGSLLGFRVFWADTPQGMVWALGGCLLSLLLGKRRQLREAPLLLPALAAFWVSAVGLLFQMRFRDTTPVGIYALRVMLAGGGTALYRSARQRGNPLTENAARAMVVLALFFVISILCALGTQALYNRIMQEGSE